jgi:hypothetical protein
MSGDEAIKLARDYLRQWVDVRPCTVPASGIYGFNPDEDCLFEVVFGSKWPMFGGATEPAAKHLTVDQAAA